MKAAALTLATMAALALAPEARAHHPERGGPKALVTVLVVHGGGWTQGSPASVEPIAERLRARGYNAFAIPYTLGNVRRAIIDVRALAQQAKRHGKVILYGGSAGGTLAAALAVRGGVDGLVSIAAPSNLLTWRAVDPYWTSEQHYADAGLASRADRRRYSPVYRVRPDAAPSLVFHSPIDHLVPVTQGRFLYHAIRRVQPDTRLVLMPEAGHSFPIGYENTAARWIEARWPVR